MSITGFAAKPAVDLRTELKARDLAGLARSLDWGDKVMGIELKVADVAERIADLLGDHPAVGIDDAFNPNQPGRNRGRRVARRRRERVRRLSRAPLAVVVQRPLQTLVQRAAWFPTQLRSGLGDIRLPLRRIVLRQRMPDQLRFRSRQLR